MPGRNFSSTSYRYGFNGKEQDGDMDGNDYDYGFRIYNPQIGKFLSVDPLQKSYPGWSPYAFAMNDVIRCIDLDGLEKVTNIVTTQTQERIAQCGGKNNMVTVTVFTVAYETEINGKTVTKTVKIIHHMGGLDVDTDGAPGGLYKHDGSHGSKPPSGLDASKDKYVVIPRQVAEMGGKMRNLSIVNGPAVNNKQVTAQGVIGDAGYTSKVNHAGEVSAKMAHDDFGYVLKNDAYDSPNRPQSPEQAKWNYYYFPGVTTTTTDSNNSPAFYLNILNQTTSGNGQAKPVTPAVAPAANSSQKDNQKAAPAPKDDSKKP